MLKKTLVFIGVAIVSCVILTLIGLKSYIKHYLWNCKSGGSAFKHN